MEKYNRVLLELRALFPHCSDIRIEIDTNTSDIKELSEAVKEISKTAFYIKTGEPIPDLYSGFRNHFGYFKLNDNGK